MTVRCLILLDKARGGIHRPGDYVTGVVKYEIDEPTKYRNVTLTLLGKGKCSWSETDSSDSSKTTSYYGDEEYVRTTISLQEKKNEEQPLILEGAYDYPFNFHLPEDIPSSYHNSTCDITYKVILTFKKVGRFFNTKEFDATIPVLGYVKPGPEGPVIYGVEKTVTKLFSSTKPKVNLKAEINNHTYTPGENINISVVIRNDTDLELKGLRSELYGYTVYTANGGRTNASTLPVANTKFDSQPLAKYQETCVPCIVPIPPDIYTMHYAKVISKEFRLTVRLPMPHFNAAVEIPVIVGEVKPEVSPQPEKTIRLSELDVNDK